jgi:hypothetical protein
MSVKEHIKRIFGYHLPIAWRQFKETAAVIAILMNLAFIWLLDWIAVIPIAIAAFGFYYVIDRWQFFTGDKKTLEEMQNAAFKFKKLVDDGIIDENGNLIKK